MTEKIMVVARCFCSQDFSGWSDQVLKEIVPELLCLEPLALKVCLTEAAPPRMTILPLQRYPLAVFSLKLIDLGQLQTHLTSVRQLRAKIDTYHVEESRPRAYQRNWPLGTKSPGIMLLTLLKKHRGLSDAAFMYEWHERHTPMALRIHPLWQYVRNVVQGPVALGTADFQGIVEESFRHPADCLNPLKLFGGGLKAPAGMLEVYRHVNTFLDLQHTQNFLLQEYLFRVAPHSAGKHSRR